MKVKQTLKFVFLLFRNLKHLIPPPWCFFTNFVETSSLEDAKLKCQASRRLHGSYQKSSLLTFALFAFLGVLFNLVLLE